MIFRSEKELADWIDESIMRARNHIADKRFQYGDDFLLKEMTRPERINGVY